MRTVEALIALVLATGAATAGANAVKPGKVEVELVSDDTMRAPGRPIRVGLRMKMDAGWHTYWKNPGDAGMPTRLSWTLPPGWTAGDIDWPAPERIPVGQLASYGYDGEMVLPVLLFAARDWDGTTPVDLAADAEWLVCKESCLPESARVTLRLAPRDSSRHRALFDAARARQPQATTWRTAAAARGDGRLELRLAPAADGQFFPDMEELVEPGDTPRIAAERDGVRWSARLGTRGRSLAGGTPIRGVWVPRTGRPLYVEAMLER